MNSAFVIENWSQGRLYLSAEIVAKARPDGRTLLLGTVGTAVTNQYLYKNISYDCELSFAPVALVAEVPNIPRCASDVPDQHIRGIRSTTADSTAATNSGTVRQAQAPP